MKIVLVLFLFAIADAAYEGDYCDKDGVAGVCTILKHCAPALEDIRNRRPLKYCGFNGIESIVCCVATPSTTTKRAPGATTEYVPQDYTYPDIVECGIDEAGHEDGCGPVDPALTSKPTGQKSWDKCLEYQDKLVFPCEPSQALGPEEYARINRCHHNADEFIIGENRAAVNEFPHMALLGYGNDPANLQWLCGGSLISEKFILTAGHCIVRRLSGEVTHVQLNVLLRSNMPIRDRYRVKTIHRHPQYRRPYEHPDIALLELEKPVTMSDVVVPACLHAGAPVNASRAFATGWGRPSFNGTISDDLQKVILTKFDALECSVTYKPSRLMKQGLDDSSQICFGDRTKSKDACLGVSGGPLQIKNKQIACMYTIVAVTSINPVCLFACKPGIYTRVANYVDWIEPIVWP